MRWVSLLAVAFLNGSCGGQAPKVAEPIAAPVPVDVARAIEGAVEQYRQAYEVRSLEGLAQLYARGLDVVTVYQGKTFQGWSEVKADQGRRLQDATKVRLVITDLSIQALGVDVAVATAGLERTIGDDATTTTERGTLTLVFHRVDTKWLVAAEHFSYPTKSS
jgi:ketosteroid isomerase-like protein